MGIKADTGAVGDITAPQTEHRKRDSAEFLTFWPYGGESRRMHISAALKQQRSREQPHFWMRRPAMSAPYETNWCSEWTRAVIILTAGQPSLPFI